jgi:hypothetical protein
MATKGFPVGAVCARMLSEEANANPTRPTRKLGTLTDFGDVLLDFINEVENMEFEI